MWFCSYDLLTGGERLVSSVQILIMIALISGQHSLYPPFGAFNMQLNTDRYRHDILMKRPSGYPKPFFERKEKTRLDILEMHQLKVESIRCSPVSLL